MQRQAMAARQAASEVVHQPPRAPAVAVVAATAAPPSVVGHSSAARPHQLAAGLWQLRLGEVKMLGQGAALPSGAAQTEQQVEEGLPEPPGAGHLVPLPASVLLAVPLQRPNSAQMEALPPQEERHRHPELAWW